MEIMCERPMTDRQAAERLGLAAQTLRNYRFQGRGPKYLKLGRAVRYRPSDLDDWLVGQLIEPEKG